MIRIIIGLAILFSLSFSKTLEKVTLQLNWKYQFEFAGFIAAKELGIYEDVGLDVEILEFDQDVNVIEDVQTNKVDFGVYAASLLRSYSKEKPIVLLSNYFKRSALVFIAKQDILTPADLIGKKIMAAPHELENSSLGTLLEKFHINSTLFKQVPHSFSTKEFIAGDVDAMTAYISNEPFHLQQQRVPYNIIDPMNYGVYGFGVNLFTSKKLTELKPETVQNFIYATNKGWAYALQNKKELVELIYNKYSQRKSKKALTFEANETEKLMLPKIYPIGYVDKKILKNTIDTLHQQNLLASDIQLNDILFEDKNSLETAITLTKDQELYLKKKEKITMCIDPDWMPYEKIKNGKHIGMTADFFSLVEQKIGVTIELVPTNSWSQSMEFAKSRKCDLFSLAMATPNRLKYMNFTKPYINFPIVIATTTDKLFISDVESMVTKEKIGIVQGYALGELLKSKYPDHKIVDVKSVDAGLKMVERGEIFGFIDPLPTIAYSLQRNYINSLKIAGKLEENLELGIGVRNDEPLLRDILEKAILLIPDGKKQEILNRYISVKYEEGFDYSLLWKIALVVFLVIVFGIYRNRQLVNHNQELTVQQAMLNDANEQLLVTQDQLQASVNSFEMLLNLAMEAIVVSKDGVCIEANSVAAKMFGYANKDELIGLTMDKVIHPESINIAQKSLLEAGQAHEIRAIKRNGEVFDLLVQGKDAILNGQEVHISMGIDITEMKNQEKLMFQQSKMAAMGEMIDNIAHQWRQPLSVISSISTGLCLQHAMPDFDKDEAVKDLKKLNDTSQHLSETIDDFRNFFRSNKVVKEFSVMHAVKKNLSLIEGILKNNGIQVVFEQIDDVSIKNYENELTQALLNIFHNAKDAMKECENRYIFINIVNSEDQVVLKVRDSGGGISSAIRDKIFEPYFTTKHQSQGTGIGLYMTHQIIENHMHGTIKVSNSVYDYEGKNFKGAEFIITLPHRKKDE